MHFMMFRIGLKVSLNVMLLIHRKVVIDEHLYIQPIESDHRFQIVCYDLAKNKQ